MLWLTTSNSNGNVHNNNNNNNINDDDDNVTCAWLTDEVELQQPSVETTATATTNTNTTNVCPAITTTRTATDEHGNDDHTNQSCCHQRRRPPIICFVVWILMMIVILYVVVRSHINHKQIGSPTVQYPYTVILQSNESIDVASELMIGTNEDEEHQIAVSPNGKYLLSIRINGNLVLRHREEEDEDNNSNNEIVWQKSGFPKDATPRKIKLSLQKSGNLVVQDQLTDEIVWKSLTGNNPDSTFVLTDGGQIVVLDSNTGYPLYIDGIPQSFPKQPTKTSGENNVGPYPVRGIFYYPWYPTTWTAGGELARFIPTLGQYDSGHINVIRNHVQQLEYGRIRLGISSWWGPDTKSDRARLLLMMDESLIFTNGRLKWCIYFEPQDGDDTVEGIQRKLQYLQQWFTDHPSYARINNSNKVNNNNNNNNNNTNKPIIFVYNKKSTSELGTQLIEDCRLVNNWVHASNNEWYVVLKIFSGYQECAEQPDSWHQYGPSTPWHSTNHEFVNISPGFWHATESTPRLERRTEQEWITTVQRMVASSSSQQQHHTKWHLITSFNEAGEGTLIESTEEWQSRSGMGYYLDALHHNFLNHHVATLVERIVDNKYT